MPSCTSSAAASRGQLLLPVDAHCVSLTRSSLADQAAGRSRHPGRGAAWHYWPHAIHESPAPHKRPDDHVIVIFGATGDLAKRKLLPGLFHLAKSGLLPAGYRVIGSAPAQFALTDDEFRAHAKAACAQFGLAKPNGAAWQEFESRLHFARG